MSERDALTAIASLRAISPERAALFVGCHDRDTELRSYPSSQRRID